MTSPLVAALLRGQRVVRNPVPVGRPDPMNPVVTNQAGFNPYTGQRLGANEYVGVAGSESEHPGQTRIPTPGWWDPSNPNYERRDYWISPSGEIVANEAGFQANPDHPFDTGREGERNSEFGSRGGYQHVAMSQPGVPTWGPGDARPDLPGYPHSGPAAGLRPDATPRNPAGVDLAQALSQDFISKHQSPVGLDALRPPAAHHPGGDLATMLSGLRPPRPTRADVPGRPSRTRAKVGGKRRQGPGSRAS